MKTQSSPPMSLPHWIRPPKAAALPDAPRLRAADPTQARRVVVLQEGARSSSGDYLLMPHVQALGLPLIVLDTHGAPPRGALQPGDFVVIARYLPAAWRVHIERAHRQLHGLAWFMDDDLADAAALRSLPAQYARKLQTLALRQKPWLLRAGAQWWVSTQALADKYAEQAPRLLPLAPGAELRPCAGGPTPCASGIVRLAYHGSASHEREHAWLLEVMRRVQAACPNTHLQVIGDLTLNRLWRELPRTTVLHPMRWESYLAHTQSQSAHIGLAPLLPGAFNAGRGAVKFYDYARMGAVGVFADVPAYRSVVGDGESGLLLPMQADLWVEALCGLAQAPERLQALRAAAVERAGAAL